MKTLLGVFRPDGEVRTVFSDAAAPVLRRLGAFPQRASRVEVIADGPHRGLFHVDFSLLAGITGRSDHAVCLARPFATHAEAVAAEVAWLRQNWILA